MKPFIKKTLTAGLSLFAIAYLEGCTSGFDDVNTDQTKVASITSTELPYLFSYALQSSALIGSNWETGESTFAGVYSQMYSQAALSFPTDRYVIRMDWLPTLWNSIYVQSAPQLRTIMDKTDAQTPENALANIWWVWLFHRTTDHFGPIPYSEAASGKETIAYDSQEAVYTDFFARLDKAIAVLKANPGKKPFGNYDLIFKGKSTETITAWLKLANTLKLRLALRISKVNPTLARKYAEEAVAAGVMTELADDAYLAKSASNAVENNGISIVAYWNEIRMSASMESILKGYNDPRMQIYFQPASATGQYDGVRNGLYQSEKTIQINSKAYNSNLGTRWVTGSDLTTWAANYGTPRDIMHCAEAYFLRAEGAINGWNMGGEAKDLYETGIKMSMNQWGITDAAAISAYISNTATPIAPQDGMNSAPVNDYPVRWSTNTTMNRKQVAQQKWLALFPDGMEGWAEIRRTTYPELYPVVHSDNADLPAGTRIKRLPFMDSEKQTNSAEVAKAVSLLKGADNAATPVWWDKN